MTTQIQESARVAQIGQELEESARALDRLGGDAPDLRSLRDAVERLQHILDLMARQLRGETLSASSASRLESCVVPDVEYGYDFWRDADDEGICGRRPAQ